ncbi:hypothetical protein COO91_09396 (plasmid) [Nostoc flagelliforme CCNUN1]|uniref:Uncharacterized protein n=1 Tax=Nostoc flagelliforme CCNUN1 TaxID=2038116 RepID=A0A2K8T6L0_9NOSO|nr:hypothetical protein COO91_09396 [Nostoc flagelliforme CCNUN1]
MNSKFKIQNARIKKKIYFELIILRVKAPTELRSVVFNQWWVQAPKELQF